MATSKTLTPTNVTIQIPAFADKPDQRVNSNCIDKEADAINALSDQIAMSAWSGSDGVRYRKSDRFVELNINKSIGGSGITVSSWSSSSAIGSISGYSNDYLVTIPFLYLTTGNVRTSGMLSISTTGDIKIYNNSGSSIVVLDIFAYALLRTNT